MEYLSNILITIIGLLFFIGTFSIVISFFVDKDPETIKELSYSEDNTVTFDEDDYDQKDSADITIVGYNYDDPISTI